MNYEQYIDDAIALGVIGGVIIVTSPIATTVGTLLLGFAAVKAGAAATLYIKRRLRGA